MKAVFVFILLLGLMGCASKGERLIKFIPGVYVREVNHEYSKGKDTLTITHLNGSVYQIDRTGAFQRIRNGQLFPVEAKKEIWTAILEEKNEVLQETKRGRIIRFDEAQKRLYMGTLPYSKIK